MQSVTELRTHRKLWFFLFVRFTEPSDWHKSFAQVEAFSVCTDTFYASICTASAAFMASHFFQTNDVCDLETERERQTEEKRRWKVDYCTQCFSKLLITYLKCCFVTEWHTSSKNMSYFLGSLWASLSPTVIRTMPTSECQTDFKNSLIMLTILCICQLLKGQFNSLVPYIMVLVCVLLWFHVRVKFLLKMLSTVALFNSYLLFFLYQAGQEWRSLRNTTIWAENRTIWLPLQLKITGDKRRVTNVPPLPPPVSVKMSLLKIKHCCRRLCRENSVVVRKCKTLLEAKFVCWRKTWEVTTKEQGEKMILGLCSWTDSRGLDTHTGWDSYGKGMI